MAEYYGPPQGDPGPDGSELFSWVAIIVCFAAFWPLGLFLLFRKLMNTSPSDRKDQSARRSSSAYRYTYSPRSGQQTGQAAPSAATPNAAPSPAPAASGGKTPLAGTGFLIAGGIMTGLFGFSLLVSLAEAITAGFEWSSFVALSGLTGVGLILLYLGFFRRKRSKLFRQYLGLIGRRESVNISTLAKATGRSYKKVCDELQDMLDANVLPMGYLDLAGDKLVLTSQGIADEPKAKPEPKKDDNAILAEIRAVNDAIPDPVMTAKIDRIGELTGKILDYQRQNPDKDSQLRSFLNYYLPTTLKILRAYAQLDRQGIEGENISAAKVRIEGMMDKVVEGFEKQLDRLFRDEALDIASDVSVLEKMLDKDGLGQNGMTLGG